MRKKETWGKEEVCKIERVFTRVRKGLLTVLVHWVASTLLVTPTCKTLYPFGVCGYSTFWFSSHLSYFFISVCHAPLLLFTS